MRTLTMLNNRILKAFAYGAMLATFCLAACSLHAQTGPFPPTDWPATINQNATVSYGVFDSKATFNTPAGWSQTVSLAGGGDQTFQPITLGGLTGDQSTSTYVNIADSGYTAWADTPVLDVLMQVYGNGNLYHINGSGIDVNFLTGTLLNPQPNNLNGVSAGLTPPGANNS